MLTVGDTAADDLLLRARLERAIRFRKSLNLEATAYRLVHGEADLLPSLVVERSGDYLAVQTLSQGMDRLLPTPTAMLVALLAPAGRLARNEPRVPLPKGMPQRTDEPEAAAPHS